MSYWPTFEEGIITEPTTYTDDETITRIAVIEYLSVEMNTLSHFYTSKSDII